MRRYEILFLAVPEITSDETNTVETQLTKLVKEHSGSVLSYERWGKMLLAYPVRDNEYGVYFLVRLEIAPQKSTELLEAVKTLLLVKFHETIMRHIIERLDERQSLTYQRPLSLEEAPSDNRRSEGLGKEFRGSKVEYHQELGA